MKEYAVVRIAHRQYIVEPSKEYVVDKFPAEEGSKLDLDVLAYGKGEEFETGKPLLEGKKATIEITGQEKGEKVTSRIYKAKSRYYRTRGHRKQVTRFKVLTIK